MVDRIVPATTDDDRAQAARCSAASTTRAWSSPSRSGQWVIEDRFAAGRPAWELAGAQLTDDVAPYELMKLRMLNGSTRLLAYLGALRGHAHDRRRRRRRRAAARSPTALIRDDMMPTLAPPDGVDLSDVRRPRAGPLRQPRPAAHARVQVAMDGSQKLPQRLVGPASRHRRRAATARDHPRARRVDGVRRDGPGPRRRRALPLDDPMADVLGQVRGTTDAATVVDRLLAIGPIFGPELPELGWWRHELVDDVRNLLAGRIPAPAVRT